ncbi:MAG: hypothetical protein F2752_06610, partial [Actinobacteria bacterium]|nr:hypothetical protein [Actinomycetota bacterium]
FSRGVLSDANSDGLFDTVASSSRTQAWNLDALGNWSTLTTNSTGQSRTHNAQNQVTGVGSTSLTYDANGSMTADESSRVFVYDAWNRLAAVRNSSNSPIVTYSIDALGRRIIEDRPNANTVDHLYYSTGWQVLEERRGGTSSGDIRRQYFWSIDYVDALTARVDYASGAVSATYHAQYDANWNITAIADATSGIVERYTYDPYGVVTVLYANWSVRGGSPYGWNYLHQGGRFDVDSNLYSFRHRDYSAPLGRWTSEDPLGFDAGDTNFYRYVGNSPGNWVDSNGLYVEWFSGIGDYFGDFMSNPWVLRGFGALQAGFGVVEVGGGFATGWTPLGAILVLHGGDNVVAGSRTVIAGQTCQTLTEGTVSLGLQQVGVSEGNADLIAGIGNGIGSAAVEARAISALKGFGSSGGRFISDWGFDVITLNYKKGIYEVISSQPIIGKSRGVHRYNANQSLLKELESDPCLNKYISQILGVEDVASQMKSGKSGKPLNPKRTEWHHPIDDPRNLYLLRRSVHRDPGIQGIIHEGNKGGYANYFTQ